MSSVHAFGDQLGVPSVSDVTPIVFVVDDDVDVRDSLEVLILCEGWQVETFESAREFLARPRPLVPSCLILALSPEDANGLEVQEQLAKDRAAVPIIFVSGGGDIPTMVKAMKAGAVNFLVKPLTCAVLLGAIREGLERSREALNREKEIRDLRNRFASLTSRQRQVMALVVCGLLNKQVGGELGISEPTVKAHRGQVMHKMNANSLADLVKIAARLRSGSQAIHFA